MGRMLLAGLLLLLTAEAHAKRIVIDQVIDCGALIGEQTGACLKTIIAPALGQGPDFNCFESNSKTQPVHCAISVLRRDPPAASTIIIDIYETPGTTLSGTSIQPPKTMPTEADMKARAGTLP